MEFHSLSGCGWMRMNRHIHLPGTALPCRDSAEQLRGGMCGEVLFNTWLCIICSVYHYHRPHRVSIEFGGHGFAKSIFGEWHKRMGLNGFSGRDKMDWTLSGVLNGTNTKLYSLAYNTNSLVRPRIFCICKTQPDTPISIAICHSTTFHPR